MSSPAECPLKPNELEVVRHLAEGTRAVEIAYRMNISLPMVRNYTKLALRVTQAGNAAGLVAMALRKRWIR